jgi:hypothetical protein
MLDAFRETIGVRVPESATELGLRLAHTAMAEAATVWAKELIDATRDPAYPAQSFPPLDKPAIAVADDADAHIPVARPAVYSSEDEDVADEAPLHHSDDD